MHFKGFIPNTPSYTPNPPPASQSNPSSTVPRNRRPQKTYTVFLVDPEKEQYSPPPSPNALQTTGKRIFAYKPLLPPKKVKLTKVPNAPIRLASSDESTRPLEHVHLSPIRLATSDDSTIPPELPPSLKLPLPLPLPVPTSSRKSPPLPTVVQTAWDLIEEHIETIGKKETQIDAQKDTITRLLQQIELLKNENQILKERIDQIRTIALQSAYTVNRL